MECVVVSVWMLFLVIEMFFGEIRLVLGLEYGSKFEIILFLF